MLAEIYNTNDEDITLLALQVLLASSHCQSLKFQLSSFEMAMKIIIGNIEHRNSHLSELALRYLQIALVMALKSSPEISMSQFMDSQDFGTIKTSLMRLCKSKRRSIVSTTIQTIAVFGLVIPDFQVSISLLDSVCQCYAVFPQGKKIKRPFIDLISNWLASHRDR